VVRLMSWSVMSVVREVCGRVWMYKRFLDLVDLLR
jgi:hypothetical protein